MNIRSSVTEKYTQPFSSKKDDPLLQESFDIDAFTLPDLSPPDPNTNEWSETKIETQIVVRGITYPCIVTFVRISNQQPHEPYAQRMQLHLELLDPKSHERVSIFKGALVDELDQPTPLNRRPTDRHVYWRIFTRLIENTYRKTGIASANLRAFEQLCHRIAEQNPLLKGEWITISTYLTSLTRLIISQKWLSEHDLDTYKRSSNEDLGYIPQLENIEALLTVLDAHTEELDDVPQNGIQEIELRKTLSSNS